MHIHFIIHEIFEGPGAFLTWAESKGHSISYSRVYAREPLPISVEDIDLLIVMGGPQSPSTTIELCPYFNAVAEIALIKRCVEAKKAVIGVCLGAQLIGEAFGATYEHSPETEIGCFPISFTVAGKKSELFYHFGNSSIVGHWHNDMPGLTDSSKVLAYSEGCPRQIIEFQKFVYGFQCHLEFDPKLIELLIAHSETELLSAKGKSFVQQPDELRKNNYSIINDNLFIFLDKLANAYKNNRLEG